MQILQIVALRVAAELERSECDRRMRRGEQEFHSLAEACPEFVIRYDLDHRIRYLNQKLAHALGVSDREAIIGRCPIAIWPDGRFAQIGDAVTEVIATGEAVTFECVFHHEIRSEWVHRLHVIPERDAEGNIVGTIAYGLDLTETKTIEKQLREQNTFRKTLLDAVERAGIDLLVIENGRLARDTDERLARRYGYDREDLDRGIPFLAIIHPDERARIAEFNRRRLTGDGSVPTHFETCALTKTGERFDYEATIVPIPDADPPRFVCVGRNISARKRNERDLQFMHCAVDQIPDALLIMDRETSVPHIRVVNEAAGRLLGYGREELVGMSLATMNPDYDLARVEKIAKLNESGERVRFETQYLTKSGLRIPVELQISHFGVGNDRRCIVVARDIAERKEIEAKLTEREHLFRTLVENSRDLIIRFDVDCRRTYANPAFAEIVERPIEDLIGYRPSELLEERNAALMEERIRSVFEHRDQVRFELDWSPRKGLDLCSSVQLTPEFDGAGRVESVLAVLRDVTELREARQNLRKLAFRDPLTGLSNRARLIRRLEELTTGVEALPRRAGLLMIDIDHFKSINDTLGHHVGDQLLREIAGRIVGCVGSQDMVARLGGDEFVALIVDIDDATCLTEIADRILREIVRPWFADGVEVAPNCSIGIAIYPEDGDNHPDLIKNADAAMYLAKRSGRATFAFYSQQLTAAAGRTLAIGSELRHALANREFELYFQPKVSLTNGEIVGSVALIRWNSPQRGLVSPDLFIPIAEDLGLVGEIGDWVLREAAAAAAEWNEGNSRRHKVAVKLSARRFSTDRLVETITSILAETQCRPDWLEIEITERLLLNVEDRVTLILSSLRSMGITIAIDDFGTGYSALSYLARFPIDTLKIDKSFIAEVTTDRRRAGLVEAIVSIGACLGQTIVAEGVGTAEQAAFLLDSGCHIAQGWLFDKAMSRADLSGRLSAPSGYADEWSSVIIPPARG